LITPKLSFSAVDIDSYITVPTLLMFVVAAGSNMPILYFFRFVKFLKFTIRLVTKQNFF